MSFGLIGSFAADAELSLLADSVRAFVADKVDHRRTRALRSSQNGYDSSLLKEIAELGWTGILVPESSGGSGLTFGAMACVVKELGHGLMAEPLIGSVVMISQAVASAENGQLRSQLLSGLARGERMPALANQEAPDGRDALSPNAAQAVAVQSRTGTRLTGSKRWVAGGGDGFVVSARNTGGIGLYWVEAGAPGLKTTTLRQIDGSVLRVLDLNDAPAESIVSNADVVATALSLAFDAAAAMACAEMCGVMEHVLETTLEYMRTRVQYDRPIGAFQALQHKAVDLFVQHQLALSAALDAVEAMDKSVSERERALEISRAKARCSDACLRIAREAIQLHGAIGFTEQYDIGLYFKRALSLAAGFGTAGHHRNRHTALSLEAVS